MSTLDLTGRFYEKVRQQMLADLEKSPGLGIAWVGILNEAKIVCEVFSLLQEEDAVPPIGDQRGRVVIRNHPSGLLGLEGAELWEASRLGNQGVGLYIVNDRVDAVSVVVEPVLYQQEEPISESLGDEFLGAQGSLAQLDKHYEERPGQIHLTNRISQAFNRESIMVAEAGTGVGKSFSYLIPALKWYEKNQQVVVISTATINLQQQIIEKDLPLAQRICSTDVKTVLVKGRGNYLCKIRLKEALQENTLFREETDPLEEIRRWDKATLSGSRSDFPFRLDDELWNRVNTDGDSCFGIQCPDYEVCFVMKARREAATAGILVVNHHLFFADLSLRLQVGFEGPTVLPRFHKVVFDEAHNLENSATTYFSQEYNKNQLMKHLSRLYTRGKEQSRGVFLDFEAIQEAPGDFPYLEALRELRSEVEIQDIWGEDFFLGESTRRLREEDENLAKLHPPLMRTKEKLLILLRGMENWYHRFEESGQPENIASLEFKMLLGRLKDYTGFLGRFMNFEEEGAVYWVENLKKEGKGYIRYVITPLDIAENMRAGVYDAYGSVIFTSATLTVDHSFDYWVKRMGLDILPEGRLICERFESPFSYEDNVLLGVPRDMPDPNSEAFGPVLVDSIQALLESNEGRALVLFTSYQLLDYCYGALSRRWALPEVHLLKQGQEDRGRLLRRFTQDVGSVLFATYSFWEGVDTPGESLRLVIICRLPFRVPTDPVYQARLEVLERQGHNAFGELSLPEAVMKFRQGFGRLMRRQSDRGSVVVLDPRLLTKSYGPLFLRSLPPTVFSRKNFKAFLGEFEDFIYPG